MASGIFGGDKVNTGIRQKGAALVVTLVLVAVALVTGLSSYQSSRLEESMAGNYRAASRAQMAAEYAAAEAWVNEFTGTTKVDGNAIDTLTEVVGIEPADSEGFSDLAAYYMVTPYTDADGEDAFGRYQVVAIGEVSQEPPVYRYVQYLAKLALGPGSAMVAAGEDDDDCANSVELISATSGAFAVEGEDEVFGSLKAAIQVACSGAMDEFAEGITGGDEESGDFLVSGADPEIVTCNQDIQGKNNLCNYVGGIQGGIDIDIFKDPNLMAQFIDKLKKKQKGDDPLDSPGDVTYTTVNSLDDADGLVGITFVTSTPYKTVKDWDDDGVLVDVEKEVWVDANGATISYTTGETNIEGDLIGVTRTVGETSVPIPVEDATDDEIFEAKAAAISSGLDIGTYGLSNNQEKLREEAIGCGDAISTLPCEAQGGVQPRVDYTFPGNITGSGVLIIDGNADFSGVPAFEGLIIVLGDYAVTGGGGGEFNGSIVSAPIVNKGAVVGDTADIPGMGESVSTDYWVGNTLPCHTTQSCGFDRKIFQFTGGGTALYNYDLDNLEMATSLLDSALGKTDYTFIEVDEDDNPVTVTKSLAPSEILAYGNGEEALYYYALNYRQSFEQPLLLSEKLGIESASEPSWADYVTRTSSE